MAIKKEFCENANTRRTLFANFTKKEVKALTLGDFLKHIRLRHGLNQTQFGDLFYRTKDYVYLIENNEKVPTAKELQLISTQLGEPVIMLVMYGLVAKDLIDMKIQN